MAKLELKIALLTVLAATGCGEGTNEGNLLDQDPDNGQNQPIEVTDSALDQQLGTLLNDQNITGDPTSGLNLPSISDPLAQLGMKLFYSKSLGGEMDSACVTCHHPSLGGTDNLSLSVGVEALRINLLGPGRRGINGDFLVPRNAPTTFNSVLYRRGLFWDSRVAQLDGGIQTPDGSTGNSLLAAQAKFPVISNQEMKTERFESDSDNNAIRGHLAARIGGYNGGYSAQGELATNTWTTEFQAAFGTSESAETLVSYDNIATAIAAYEGSQVFINNPWKNYLDGNNNAISDNAKRGAVLFFTSNQNGGGDCSRCHSGDFFSDEQHHVVAFPQTGPGKGDGNIGNDDFGLERETDNANDRYKFRTPSLLNASMTAPYGHTGAYQSLRDVVSHYDRPSRAIDFFNDNDWCETITDPANAQNCNTLFHNARANTQRAQTALNNQPRNESINGVNLNNNEVDQIVEFLETLTDPCIQSRTCLSAWIPAVTGGPDGNQLNAVDRLGNAL
ncbi:MAG: cytochrome c peroxidase [Patiriisocius sp.]